MLIAISVVVTLLGIGIAWRLYRPSQVERWVSFPEREPGMAGVLGHAFYVDDLYAWVVSNVGLRGAAALEWFDRMVIDGAVNGVGGSSSGRPGSRRSGSRGRCAGTPCRSWAGRRPVPVRGGEGLDGRALAHLAIVAPLVGLPVLLLWRSISDDAARWVGLASTLVAFAVSIGMLAAFDTGEAGFQMVSKHPWVESVGLSWFLGVDGFSVWLVMVTTFMFPIAIAAS